MTKLSKLLFASSHDLYNSGVPALYCFQWTGWKWKQFYLCIFSRKFGHEYQPPCQFQTSKCPFQRLVVLLVLKRAHSFDKGTFHKKEPLFMIFTKVMATLQNILAALKSVATPYLNNRDLFILWSMYSFCPSYTFLASMYIYSSSFLKAFRSFEMNFLSVWQVMCASCTVFPSSCTSVPSNNNCMTLWPVHLYYSIHIIFL